ncbi:transcriptional regulator [Paenibacillus sp. BIC5C1]|uniref:helix-turn-helix domain-containing protein n=1 Tax=Paenibacillus sp. BIC5C1 TaxID=3078263 RepID=UPI0028E8D720|nr:transcriptional regulator [Paenibacillus sp. BIC5C1]
MHEKEFGSYLRELRKGKGLTTSKLAEGSGISQSYISQIETGNRGIPTDDILMKLADGLGVDYMDLLSKAGKDRSPFDVHLRNFVKLLIGDNELPFAIERQGEFEECLERLFIKHNLKPNKTIHIKPGTKHSDIVEQYIDMVLDIENTSIKWELLQDLQDLAHKYHLWFNPKYEHQPYGIKNYSILEDLYALLNRNGRITYKGHAITEKERTLIENYLDALFSET